MQKPFVLGSIGQISRAVSDILLAASWRSSIAMALGRAYAELQARGVEFNHAPHLVHRHADGTEEWMAFFKDPDSRPLALMSQVKA